MDIASIIQIVVLVLDISFFLTLGLTILFGFIKGWKKSTLNLVAYLVSFLLIICFSGLIAKGLLNIKISGEPIGDYIINTVSSSLYPDKTPSPELNALCTNVATSVMKLAIYLVGLLVALILSFIIRLIFGLTLKKFIYSENDGKKCAPSIKARLFGLIPGFANFVMIMVVLFYPLAGVINIGSLAVADIKQIEEMIPQEVEQKVSEEDDMFQEIFNSLDKSVMDKIIGLGKNKNTGVSIAGSYLGSIMTIKNNGVSVNLISEYGRIRQIIPVVSKVMKSSNENEIAMDKVTDEDVNKITNAFKETKLLKLTAPVISEYIIYELSKDETNQEVINNIKELDIMKEVDIITNAVVEVIETCKELEVNLETPQDMLLTPSLPVHVNKLMDIVFDSNIMNYIVMPYAIESLVESIPEEYDDIKVMLTADNIKKCLKQDVGDLIYIYQNLAKNNNIHNFIFNEEDIILGTEEALNTLENSIIKLFGISIISGHEETLIKFALDQAKIDGLTYETLFDGVNPNWQEEVKVIASTFKAAAEVANTLDLLHNQENLSIEMLIQKDENGNYILETLLNEMASSEMFKTVVLNYLENCPLDEQTKEIIDIINLEIIKELSAENFKAEFSRLLQIFDSLVQMNLLNDNDIKVESNNIKSLINNALNSVFIKGNEDKLIKFALDQAKIEGLTYETLFGDYHANWDKEATILGDAAGHIVEIINTHDISKLEITILTEKDENNEYIFKPIINDISKSELLKNIFVNYVNTIKLDETTKEVFDIINFNVIKTMTENEFNDEFINLLEMFDLLVNMNFISEENIKLDSELMKQLINKALNSIFIKGNENELVKFALNQIEIEGLNYESLIGDYQANWEEEAIILGDTVADIIKLTNEHKIDKFTLDILVKKDSNEEYIFKPLISDISKSGLLKHVFINYIDHIELDEESKEILDLLDISIVKDISNEQFESELLKLLDVIDTAISMNFTSSEDIKVDKVLIEKLILTLFDSIFVKGKEQQIIEYILKTTNLDTVLQENNIILNYTNVNWETEPQCLVDIFVAILDLGDLNSFDIGTLLEDRTEEIETKIINLMDAFGRSDIFKDSIFIMIETMVKNIDYEVTFTEEEKQKVLQNTWAVEIQNLFDLIDFCTDKLGDTTNYNTITGTEITEMMTKASSTVIATKILGTVLNEMLGDEYLAINPKVDGVYKYDFTNSETLSTTAIDIGALVDLKNHAQNLDMSDITSADQSIDKIIESVKILDESGLAKDMIQEVIGTDSGINLDEVDLSKEADTIKNVYDVYKEDHENFDINEHPELKEEIENSEFAKTILDMLGIGTN